MHRNASRGIRLSPGAPSTFLERSSLTWIAAEALWRTVPSLAYPPDFNERKGAVMSTNDTPTVGNDPASLARQYLRLEKAVDQPSRSHRTYFVGIALNAGLTFRDIVTELGVNEVDVHGVLEQEEG